MQTRHYYLIYKMDAVVSRSAHRELPLWKSISLDTLGFLSAPPVVVCPLEEAPIK
jgi:hypothetical protein